MAKSDYYPDLKDIVSGGSYQSFFQWLHNAALMRYTTEEHLKQLHEYAGKYATPKKLNTLREAGYIAAIRNGDVFVLTKKGFQALDEQPKLNTSILQRDFRGMDLKHTLEITQALINIRQEEHFFTVFYPTLTVFNSDQRELKPDACIVYRKENAYKIVFLEVENPKPDSYWTEHLEGKHDQYNRIAKDIRTFDWWKEQAGKLKLPIPVLPDFCFSIRVIGNIKKEWGEGFEFKL